jgi:hypothetical protein
MEFFYFGTVWKILAMFRNNLGFELQVQSHKFIPLVYQIASRLGSSKDAPGPRSFQVQ